MDTFVQVLIIIAFIVAIATLAYVAKFLWDRQGP